MRPPVPTTLPSVAFPSGIHVGERKSERRHAGNVLAPGVREVAAAQLPRALEQMADHRAAREAVDVTGCPAVLVHERRHEQRRIGDAAGDDDVGAAGERRQHRLRAEIGVGRHDGSVVRQRKARLHGGRIEIERIEYVVPGHGSDLDGNAHALRDRDDRVAPRQRIGGAQIADEADSLPGEHRQQRLDAFGQPRIEAALRIAPSS